MVDDAVCALWSADCVGRHLPIPNSLDADDVVQDGSGRDEGQYHPLGGLHAKMARLEIIGPVAQHDLRDIDSAGRVP